MAPMGCTRRGFSFGAGEDDEKNCKVPLSPPAPIIIIIPTCTGIMPKEETKKTPLKFDGAFYDLGSLAHVPCGCTRTRRDL
eukprot:COSAG02_NODE_795_length_17133_cov_6.577727_3_plen_81_part_00